MQEMLGIKLPQITIKAPKSNFDAAFLETLGHEGGYSNHKSDKGGETYKGIARKYHPSWDGWRLVDQLKQKMSFPSNLNDNKKLQKLVKRFYKESFWDQLYLDKISEYPICNELFDTGVNQGVHQAGLYLQQALNLLNNDGEYYRNISEDGAIGPNTLAAYTKYIKTANFNTRNEQDVIKILLKALNGLQFERYKSIVQSNEQQEVFFYGWLKRV